MAVNVTVAPAQILLEPAIVTEAATVAVTLIVMVLEVAVAGLTHDKLEAMVQLICCPFVKEGFVYVALLVPTSVPSNVQ